MSSKYHRFLPEDFYYRALVKSAWEKLDRGENVLVGGIYGCGVHTFLSVFFQQEKLGEEKNVECYPAGGGVEELKRWVETRAIRSGGALVIYGFERIADRRGVLEWLGQRKQLGGDVVYLVVADHTMITDPKSYTAYTSPFFGERLVVKPFDFESTKRLIEINAEFYGWGIDSGEHEAIFGLTGGIQRLVKHVCRLACEQGIRVGEMEKFSRDPSILFQLDLMASVISTCSLGNLMELGVVDELGKIRSSLVSWYWKSFRSEVVRQLLPNLAHLECRVASVLYENRGKVVSIDGLGDVLELEGSEFSPWAIYKLISRLKPKMEKNFVIKSVKGKGYILEVR